MTESSHVQLIFMINEVAWLLRRDFQERTRALKITQAQARALAIISRRPGLTQKALANRLDVGPMAVVRLLDRMQRAGWVKREDDPKDRRAIRLYLAPQAKPLQQKLHELAEDIGMRATSQLSAEDADKLTSILRSITTAFTAQTVETTPRTEVAAE